MRNSASTLLAALLLIATAWGLEGFDPNDDLKEAIDDFQAWFEQHYDGDVKVRLSPAGEGMRMGVFAVKDIAPESKYLSIPTNIIIGEETMFKDPDVGPTLGKIQNHLRMERRQATLALFLIYHKFILGKKSFWYPYIRLIPSEHNTPEFYTKEDLRELNGTFIRYKVRWARKTRKSDYDILRKEVFTRFSDVFPLHTYNYENWAWANGILNTRMIWWDGKPNLVPMLDMINCRQGPNPNRVHSTKRGPGNRADTLAPWRFKAGDQVFENYGQPNPTYFLYHGFVMRPNVHDCAHVAFKAGSVGRNREDKLRRMRVWKDEYCVTSAKYSEMLLAARMALADEADFEEMEKKTPHRKFSNENERDAVKLVGESIKEQLEQFAPHDPKWEANIAGDDVPFRKKMIVTFRESQRGLLARTLKVLRKAHKRIPKPEEPVPEPEPEPAKAGSDASDDDGEDFYGLQDEM